MHTDHNVNASVFRLAALDSSGRVHVLQRTDSSDAWELLFTGLNTNDIWSYPTNCDTGPLPLPRRMITSSQGAVYVLTARGSVKVFHIQDMIGDGVGFCDPPLRAVRMVTLVKWYGDANDATDIEQHVYQITRRWILYLMDQSIAADCPQRTVQAFGGNRDRRTHYDDDSSVQGSTEDMDAYKGTKHSEESRGTANITHMKYERRNEALQRRDNLAVTSSDIYGMAKQRYIDEMEQCESTAEGGVVSDVSDVEVWPHLGVSARARAAKKAAERGYWAPEMMRHLFQKRKSNENFTEAGSDVKIRVESRVGTGASGYLSIYAISELAEPQRKLTRKRLRTFVRLKGSVALSIS